MRDHVNQWKARMDAWKFSAMPETVKKPRKKQDYREFILQSQGRKFFRCDFATIATAINPAHLPQQIQTAPASRSPT